MALLGAGWALVTCGLVFWGRHPSNAVGPLLVAAGLAWFLARVGYSGRRLGARVHRRAGLLCVERSPRGVGDPRVSDWSAGLARGTCCRRSLPGGRRTRAGSPAGSRLRPGDVRLLAVPGQSPARRRRAGAFRRSRTTRRPLRPGLVAPVDRGCGLESGAFEPDEAARRRAGRPGGVRVPRPRCRLLRHELRARVRGQRRPRAAALARPGRRAHRARGCSRLEPAPGQSDALVARPARRGVGRVALHAGRLREGIAETLADPALEIAYPIGEGRYVDARGRPVDLARGDDRVATPLVREDGTVALLLHRSDLLDNPELIEEVASAARLALENERLQAEARAQVEDLRIVAHQDRRGWRRRAAPARARPPRRGPAAPRRPLARVAPAALAAWKRRR